MRSQRPWLVNDGLASLAIGKVSNDSISGEFTFTVKNFGPSPALVVGEEIRPLVRTFQEKTNVFEEARRGDHMLHRPQRLLWLRSAILVARNLGSLLMVVE